MYVEYGWVGFWGIRESWNGWVVAKFRRRLYVYFFFYIGIKEFNEVEFIAYVMVFEIIVGEILLKG